MPVSSVDQAPGAFTLSGIANLHSHAFQRAMAGLAERRESAEDSFWSWREWMYRFAGMLAPDDLRAITRQLYVEMLEAGYTQVCEFHYLHHDLDGRAYAPAQAMAEAIIEAAEETGIRLTLLPVLYQRGGFDDRSLSARQRRFGHALDDYLRLFDTLRRKESRIFRTGLAFHSLRAVAIPAMREVLEALDAPGLPVHLHIAEQAAEVMDCLAAHGQRPVQRLLDQMPVDRRWCLVHATHVDADELRGIAASGAVVALCPSTEANLGDGLFPLRAFLAEGGRYGIGSDSHVSVSPVEELRWLEYGQRLIEQKRSRALLGSGSTATAMLAAVEESAASVTGWPAAVDGSQEPVDRLLLDADAPAFAGARASDVRDRWIFCGNLPVVREVHVDGRRVVAEGRHFLRDVSRAEYAATMRRLLAE